MSHPYAVGVKVAGLTSQRVAVRVTSKDPNEINMVGTEGDLTGKEAQGIYSVQNDTLQICYTMPGAPRPTEFKSPAGAKAYLIEWKRLR